MRPPVTTKTVGVLNMVSTDALALAREISEGGHELAAAEVLAAATLIQQAAGRILDAIEAERSAMLRDDNP